MVVGIVLAVAALAQDPGEPTAKREDQGESAPVVGFNPAPTPTNAKKTTLLFPEIEGWTMSPKQTYPTPELGYSNTYESNGGGRVTISSSPAFLPVSSMVASRSSSSSAPMRV